MEKIHKEVDAGYILLHRSVRQNWIWNDSVKLKWWLDILMECNHSDQKVSLKFELIDCKRGQSLNSLQTWSKRWGCNVGQVRRFLKMLQTDKMIVTENVRKSTRITVCNYDSYNDPRHANDKRTTRKRISNEFGPNTNKERDKERERGSSTSDQKLQIPKGPEGSFNAEETVLAARVEFEAILIKTGVSEDRALSILRKYHLWLEEHDKYPKQRKSIFAGFEKWIMNEQSFGREQPLAAASNGKTQMTPL